MGTCMMVRVVALLILVLVVSAASASAVVLCAKPRPDGTFNTSVRIRETCRPNERQLDPAALGLQGPPGPTGATGTGAAGPTGPTGATGPQGAGLVVKD